MEQHQDQGVAAERAVLEATRALLRIGHARDVRAIAATLVDELGGDLVEAADDPADAVPVDLSFGVGPPVLARPTDGISRMLLERFLPAFAEDGARALALVRTSDRLALEADIDPLTGLANRRASGRALGRVGPGDVVVLIDLDRFKQLNDTLGHDDGDRVLKEFGAVLRDGIRQQDHAGRHGGDEFLLVLAGASVDDARALCERVRLEWRRRRPHAIGFSAGIASVQPGTNPITVADRALYRAKELGRDRDQVATDEEHAWEDNG